MPRHDFVADILAPDHRDVGNIDDYPDPAVARANADVKARAALKITSVSFGRTINLGNYESARIDATADVPDGDDPDGVWTRLVAWVNQRVDEPAPQLRRS